MKRECLGPEAHFSKVPVTFQARSYILKSKSLERWHSFRSANQANLFYQLRILLGARKVIGTFKKWTPSKCAEHNYAQ